METKLLIMGIIILLCFIFLIYWFFNLEQKVSDSEIIGKCYKIFNQIFKISDISKIPENAVLIDCS